MRDKRAQISETTTWIVATIIILIILTVSVFLSSLVGQNKSFPVKNQFDSFVHQSFTSYLLTKDVSGQTAYNEIKNDEALNDFNGNLANKIFVNLYSGYYDQTVFLGIDTNAIINPMQANKYFNVPAGQTPNSLLIDRTGYTAVRYSISLNNKLLRLILWHTD